MINHYCSKLDICLLQEYVKDSYFEKNIKFKYMVNNLKWKKY